MTKKELRRQVDLLTRLSRYDLNRIIRRRELDAEHDHLRGGPSDPSDPSDPTWSEFHSESERLATDAQLLFLSRKYREATALYKRAADAEKQALDSLDVSKVRTRGITAVSAVALYFKSGEYTIAEKLAYSMLADLKMPEFANSDLRTLVQAIWTENAKNRCPHCHKSENTPEVLNGTSGCDQYLGHLGNALATALLGAMLGAAWVGDQLKRGYYAVKYWSNAMSFDKPVVGERPTRSAPSASWRSAP